MWWLAAPLVIGAGKLIYDAVTEDDSSSSSYSDRDEREREVKERAKQEERREVLSKINSYKKQEIIYILEKYNYIINIKNTESFAKDVHQVLINGSVNILNILKSKFGNSFVSLKGTLKEDVLTKHIEKLTNIFSVEILNKLSHIENIKYLSYEDIKNILGIDIEYIFKKSNTDIEEIISFFREDNQTNVFIRIKYIYKIEKTYQNFISAYKIFHTYLSNVQTLNNIEQYTLDNIEIYTIHFNDTHVDVISKNNELEKINLLQKETSEIEEVIKELEAIKNETLK